LSWVALITTTTPSRSAFGAPGDINYKTEFTIAAPLAAYKQVHKYTGMNFPLIGRSGRRRPSGHARSRTQITRFGAAAGSYLRDQVAEHIGGSRALIGRRGGGRA
jgi:hypothetical protein